MQLLFKNNITLLTFVFAVSFVSAQQITINEFMSSNSATIADEDGDFEDWIEVYNFGTEPVNLSGFGISDDADEPFRWVFPEVTIQPEGFLLVWASGKNRTNTLQPLHTNFSIKAEGEELLLSNPTGQIICEIAPLNLPTDISYGQNPDAGGVWLYFDEPTPGESNATQGYSEILEPPIFSHNGGFYSDEFELTLSHPDPEVTIYYTLDGSIPDPDNLEGTVYYYKNQYPQNVGDPFGDSLTGSFITHSYNQPITISDRSLHPDSITHRSSTWHFDPEYFPENPVFKGTAIRVYVFKEGALPCQLKTETYFITPLQNNRYSLPVFSLAIPEASLFDYENGIYVAGVNFDNWRLDNPDAVPREATPANYHNRGDQWEYPGNIELFETDHAIAVINQQAGLRIHGGNGRAYSRKTLRFYARSEYGCNFFEYRLFNDKYSCYKRFLLRNSGDDGFETNFRDAFIQTLAKNLLPDIQDYRPAILFINGEYWGIHNLRERYDKYYINRVYEVAMLDIDLLTGPGFIVEGDASHYNETIAFIENNSMEIEDNYNYIKTRIDVDNFIDYQLINIFSRNVDWPGNNIDYWRKRTDDYEPDAPYGHDGRWRWLIYDTDAGMAGWGNWYQHNMLVFATVEGNPTWPNPDWSTFLLRSLLKNDEFRIAFINKYADLLNTEFHPNRINQVFNQLLDKIEPEIAEHLQRWDRPQSYNHWLAFCDTMYNYAIQRHHYQKFHITDFFDLEGYYNIQLSVSNQWHGHVKINTIEINENSSFDENPYPWTGLYFKGIPISIEAIPRPGYVFSHWEGDASGNIPVISLTPDDDISVVAHFERDFSPQLISFWLFDNTLPNDTPLEEIESTYSLTEGAGLEFHSALEGYPFDPEHPNWRKASMERRNAPTPINYRPDGNNNIAFENANMRGLQIKQPFSGDGGENTLNFNLPTDGYKNIIFCFAAKDEDAADFMMVEYSTATGQPQWTNAGLENPFPELGEEYQLYEFDFSGIDAADDNEDFKIRLRFGGDNLSADEGDRVTFNNFSLDGTPLEGENLPPVVVNPPALLSVVEEGELLEIDLNNVFMDPDNDPLLFTAISNRPFMASVQTTGSILTISPIRRGDATITLGATDSNHNPVYIECRVMVYPKSFILHSNDFAFLEWAADSPEYSYPENILFLQSDQNDPGLGDALLHPYYIPHSDYHPDDEATTGFPYNNTRRTRINGLGDEGISFINTGRGRDLGGLLLSLDTRDVEEAKLSFIAETILQNERSYGIRLQYRTDLNVDFTNFVHNAQYVEYLSGEDGDAKLFEDIILPPALLNRENVQLLWKYYYVAGDSGPRAQIRMDNITLSNVTIASEIPKDQISIFAVGNNLVIRTDEYFDGRVFLYDLSGGLVQSEKISGSDHYIIGLRTDGGLFIARVVDEKNAWVQKVFVR
jgi:hypothetical protein